MKVDEFMDEDEQDHIEQKRKLGDFDGAGNILEEIEKYEEENLQPRSWELAGEVTAGERQKDELLDKFIDADFRSKTAPIITAEFTEQLESIILKRIKDKSFDDVVRKKRESEALIPQYHRNISFEDGAHRSLADVYEEEFKGAQETDELANDPQLDEAVKEVEKDINALFSKLDALSHYSFRPAEVKPEVKIVKNVASLRAEEVGPMASTEPTSSLLAPEEVVKHIKAPPKAKDEQTVTDRKRLRRKKKLKQKILAKKGLMSPVKGDDDDKEGAENGKKLRRKRKKAMTEAFPEKRKKTGKMRSH